MKGGEKKELTWLLVPEVLSISETQNGTIQRNRPSAGRAAVWPQERDLTGPSDNPVMSIVKSKKSISGHLVN